MNEVPITLGGKTFMVSPPTIRREAKWRQQAERAMTPFWDAAAMRNMDINEPDDLRQMVTQAGAFLDPMPALDAICAYAPQLADEREWIEENCYSHEVIATLVALFFGQLRQLEQLPQILNGVIAQPMPTT